MGSRGYYVLVAGGIILFVVLRWEFLFLPYFWDEMGVYARGALAMDAGSLGLIPGSLDPDLSRGHPLLFYFLAAVNFRIFGTSVQAAHFFAMFISILLAAALFHTTRRHYGAPAGAAAVIMLLAQQVFAAQSAMLLPEIMLALFVLLGMDCVASGKMGWYVLYATAAIFVKETGIVLAGSALAWNVLFGGEGLKDKLRLSLYSLLPLLPYGIYLAANRMTYGWYFFPYHSNLIASDLAGSRLLDYLMFLFVYQKRWLLSGILLAWAVIMICGKKAGRKEAAWLLPVVGLLPLAFFEVYLNRYMMPAIPFLCLLAGAGLSEMIRKDLILNGAAITIAVVAYFARLPGVFTYDTDPRYDRYVNLTEEAVRWCESELNPGRVYANFPLNMAMTRREFGYVDKPAGLVKTYGPEVDFVVISSPPGFDFEMKERARTVKTFETAFFRIDVFRVVR